jgi:hypothetical protein
VQAWAARHDARCRTYLSGLAAHEPMRARLRELLDVDDDGLTAIGAADLSSDGSVLAWATARAGVDWLTVRSATPGRARACPTC